MPPLLVSKKTAAEMLGGRSRTTIEEMIARGQLKAVRDGKRIFITVASLNAYVNALAETRIKEKSRGAPPTKAPRHK
jgi:excisionase family DNA binding protein